MNEGQKLEDICHAMMLAWGRIKKAQARMWGDWMTIGEGLLEGRRWAMQQAGTNRPEGKGYVMAYAEWLKHYKVDDMDKSDRAKLLQLMEERPGVEEWRATLTDYERRNLNNPTIAWRKWTAATKVKKPKPRTAGTSATEHGRALSTLDQQQARIEELEEELAAAEERIRELESALAAAGVQQEDAESAGGLEWTGADEEGYIARALVEGIAYAYTVVPVTFRGCDHFEAKIIKPDADFTLPVRQLAARYGISLTRDLKGQSVAVKPVPTVAEAKELCEIAYAQQ